MAPIAEMLTTSPFPRQVRGQVGRQGGVAVCCSICCPYSVIERSHQCLCYCKVNGSYPTAQCGASCDCPCCRVSSLDCPQQRAIAASRKKERLAARQQWRLPLHPAGSATDARKVEPTKEQWDLLLPNTP